MKKKFKIKNEQKKIENQTTNQTINIKKLLKKNLTMRQIIEATGLTETEINKIKAIQRKYRIITKVVTCILVIVIIGILYYIISLIIWFNWYKNPMPGLGEMVNPIVDVLSIIICLIVIVICTIVIKKIKQKL